MSTNGNSKKDGPVWLIYGALIIAGVLLLADAMNVYSLMRISARIGIGLVWTAIALLVGKGRWAGNFAVVIVWAGVIATFIL